MSIFVKELWIQEKVYFIYSVRVESQCFLIVCRQASGKKYIPV